MSRVGGWEGGGGSAPRLLYLLVEASALRRRAGVEAASSFLLLSSDSSSEEEENDNLRLLRVRLPALAAEAFRGSLRGAAHRNNARTRGIANGGGAGELSSIKSKSDCVGSDSVELCPVSSSPKSTPRHPGCSSSDSGSLQLLPRAGSSSSDTSEKKNFWESSSGSQGSCSGDFPRGDG